MFLFVCVTLRHFICRMHIQTCITFHKTNLSNYFLIIVSSHHYTYPTAYDQLVYELFVYLRCTYHPLFFLNLWDDFAFMWFLSQTDGCALFLLLAANGSWIFSNAQNFATSLHSLYRRSGITACLIVLVILLGRALLSVLIILLWLNLKKFLYIILTVRLVRNAYTFFIQLKFCCYCLCIG